MDLLPAGDGQTDVAATEQGGLAHQVGFDPAGVNPASPFGLTGEDGVPRSTSQDHRVDLAAPVPPEGPDGDDTWAELSCRGEAAKVDASGLLPRPAERNVGKAIANASLRIGFE